MIYVASPYSHPLEHVRNYRYQQVLTYTYNLKHGGALCFSPIVYGRQFEIAFGAPADFQWWRLFNDHMLFHSQSMHVLKLDGWRHSEGIEHEVAFAQEHDKPVTFIQPDWMDRDG